MLETDARSVAHLVQAVPQFSVADVVQTAEHYRDCLGFEIAGYWDGEREHHDPAGAVYFGIVERDSVRLHFNRAESGGGGTRRARGAYDVYFHAVELDRLAAELRDRGARIKSGPEDRVYGQRELVVEDCNGLVLAFGEDIRGRATQQRSAQRVLD